MVEYLLCCEGDQGYPEDIGTQEMEDLKPGGSEEEYIDGAQGDLDGEADQQSERRGAAALLQASVNQNRAEDGEGNGADGMEPAQTQ